MKTLRLLSTLALATTLAACGNDGFLSNLTGGGNGASAQAEAIEGLGDGWCTQCNGPDGEAAELFADVTPEAYDGGPFEFALVVGSPAGLLDETGAWKVQIIFRMNEYDLFAAIPFEAWKFSELGTKARVVLIAEEGLPAGEYHAAGAIIAGEHAADDSEVYVVHAEEEPGEEHPDQPGEDHPGEDHPDPTPTPDGEPDPDPTPNPEPDV